MIGSGDERLSLHQLEPISVLGRGGKGVVFLVRHRSTNQLLALKVSPETKTSRDKLWFEPGVLGCFSHPLLPKLRGVVETDKVVGFAMDYCPGGDLSSLRKKQSDGIFSEEVIRFFAVELVIVLEHLHQLGFVYRDLKPDNIVIQENGHLMLIDFDLSKKLGVEPPKSNHPLGTKTQSSPSSKSKQNKLIGLFCRLCNSGIQPEQEPEEKAERFIPVVKSGSFVGTEEYIAPEIILRSDHDFSADFWSLGVVLYEMLRGKTPFRGMNSKDTFRRILTKEPELAGEDTALRDLIQRLLHKDPIMRISGDEIKGHHFFAGVKWDEVLEEVMRPPHIPLNEAEVTNNSSYDDIDIEVFAEETLIKMRKKG